MYATSREDSKHHGAKHTTTGGARGNDMYATFRKVCKHRRAEAVGVGHCAARLWCLVHALHPVARLLTSCVSVVLWAVA